MGVHNYLCKDNYIITNSNKMEVSAKQWGNVYFIVIKNVQSLTMKVYGVQQNMENIQEIKC